MVGQKKTDIMISGKVSSVLFSLVLPMILGMFALLVINLVDAYYIGKLGVNHLAAISFSFPVFFTVMSFNIGIAIGTSATVSRYIGAGDLNNAKLMISNILLFIILFTSIVSIIGLISISPLFKLLGANSSQLPLVKDYMSIWYLGAPFFGFLVIANSVLRANGDAVTPSMIILLTSTVNAFLDPILIFGFGPINAMGIKGAAVATSISYVSGMLGMLLILYNRKLVSFPTLKFYALLSSCKPIFLIGLPAGFTMMLNPIVLALVNKIVSYHGSSAVAAFGVGLRIESLATIGIIAISSSLTPFLGQNIGAVKMDRIKSALYYSIIFSLIWGLAVAIPLILFSESISRIFSDEIEVQTTIIKYLRIVSLSYIFWGWSNIASAAFNGFQKPMHATIVFLGRLFVLTVPMILIGDYFYGLAGIFYAICIANIFSGIIAFTWCNYFILKQEKFFS